MKKLVFVSLVLAMLFTTCAKEQLSEIEVTNESGVVIERYSMNLETKQKQGLHQAFYSSSKLSCESNYVNDTLDGKRIWYYEDGAIEIEENFKMGAYDGVIKTYFEDGQLKQEGIYSNDQATGVWKTYYASGQLKEEVAFENSLENGPFVEYHESGAIKSKGQYKDGPKEEGTLELYDESGVLIKKMECRSGVCLTSWTKDGGTQIIDETLFEISK